MTTRSPWARRACVCYHSVGNVHDDHGRRDPSDARSVRIRARLFDAQGEDREVGPSREVVPARGADQLLWVDLDARSEDALARVGEMFRLSRSLLVQLSDDVDRSSLTQYPDHIHLSLETMEPPGSSGRGDVVRPVRQALDLVVGAEWIVTVHDGPSAATDRLMEGMKGQTRLGALDAADFVAAIIDSVIVGYHRTVEAFEREIDALDELALRARRGDDVLGRLVDLRRRIGSVRQALAPQREAFAPLGRPDLALHEELGRPWPELLGRLERALDAVERLRESLLGTYDVYMGRLTQRSNDVMKALTVLSAILLPSVVLAGVMGMNFKVAFFDESWYFFVVIAAMVAMAVAILGVARWREWL
jgi:magnesium transporter